MEGALFWCSGCERNLSPEAFYYRKNGKRKGKRDSICKECRSRYYRQNKNNIVFDNHRRLRKKLVDEVTDAMKALGCVDCSQVYMPAAMDFDHVRGTKKFSISNISRSSVSDEEMLILLQAELALCEVCCANCHRRRTISRYKTCVRRDYAEGNLSSTRLNDKHLYAYEVLTTKGCVDCGIKDVLVLEFDHVRGTKVEALSRMLPKPSYSVADVAEEISKCEVRCVTCHRIQTFQRGMNPSEKWRQGARTCECGEKKSPTANQCQACYQKTKGKLETYPTLDEIILGVETYGWVQYSKTVGMSDSGVRKLARRLGAETLPKKKR